MIRLLLVLLTACSALPPPVDTQLELPDFGSVATLSPRQGGRVVCAAVFVRADPASDPALVTAAHCVDREVAWVAFGETEDSPWVPAVLDFTEDVAVLRPQDGSPGASAALLRPEELEPGTEVVLVGHPAGLVYSFSVGHAVHYRQDETGRWLQISAPSSPGNSGGPVFDSAGRVVGLAVGRASIGGLWPEPHLGRCVPASALRAALEKVVR